jgi:hypothetical protein
LRFGDSGLHRVGHTGSGLHFVKMHSPFEPRWTRRLHDLILDGPVFHASILAQGHSSLGHEMSVNRVSYKDASANQTYDCCDRFNHFINPMYGFVPRPPTEAAFHMTTNARAAPKTTISVFTPAIMMPR